MTQEDRYRDVRSELEQHGYLTGPVQRFVFRELMVEHSRSARLARTASKAAILGGPLLGLWLALTAAVSNRPLLAWTDVVWLWLYFAVISAGVLFLLVAGVAWAVGALARHRPGGGARGADALRGALIVGVPTLIYLLFVWSRRGTQDDWLADAIFLIGANLAALLVAWLAGLVSLVSAVGRSGAVPDRNRRSVAILLLVLLPLTAIGWTLRTAWGDQDPKILSAFEPEPQPTLWMLALDGWDRGALDRWAERDTSFAAIRSSSIRYPLRREPGLEPAEVWTTIATGVPASVHGVTSAGGERLPGVATPLRRGAGPVPLRAALEFLLPTRTVPITGRGRSSRALWEIVGLKSPTLSIGWWASWPADQDLESRGRSFVLTDRLLPKLLSQGAFNRETEPAALSSRLQTDFPDLRRSIRGSFDAAFGDLEDPSESGWVWESFLIDGFHLALIDRLGSRDDLGAVFVYFPGLDILRQRSFASVESIGRRYEVWLSAELSRRLEDAEWKGYSTLLIADPGRSASEDGGEVIAGPVGRGGCDGPAVDPTRVAAMALRMTGYPSSLELGAVPEPAGCGALPGPELPPVPSFGRRSVDVVPLKPEDEAQILERLRSLGYLD